MLTKEQFVDAINFIKKQRKKEDGFCEALEKLSPFSNIDCFLYSDYEAAYLRMIKVALGLSEDNDILAWWMYDREYDILARPDIDTPELLYDYIMEEEKKRNENN